MPNQTAVILHAVLPEELTDFKETFAADLSFCKDIDTDTKCAVSNLFTDLKSIHAAYLEADYAFYKGNFRKQHIVAFWEMIPNYEKNYLDLAMYRALEAGLNGKDVNIVTSFFDDLEKKLENEKLSSPEREQIFYSLHTIIYNHLVLDVHMPQELLAGTEKYFEFQTVQFYLEKFRLISQKIIENNIEQQSCYHCTLKKQVLDYINQQYNNPSLSLSLIADYFGVSPKYVSDFIKESSGKNYVDYVQELRLNRAIELMKQDSISIQQISESVGYFSMNTFYKSFKRYYGVSPSTYRSNMQPQVYGREEKK